MNFFSLCTSNSVVARLFSSLFADIVKDFSQMDFQGTAYLYSCGGVLVRRRSEGGIGVYFNRVERYGGCCLDVENSTQGKQVLGVDDP